MSFCHAGHYDSAANGAHCRRLGVGMVAFGTISSGYWPLRRDSGVSHDLALIKDAAR